MTVEDLKAFSARFGDLDDPDDMRPGLVMSDPKPGTEWLIDKSALVQLGASAKDRAVNVLTLLADRGQHGAASVPDLIVAAIAEVAGLGSP